jgi:hypothetical protein
VSDWLAAENRYLRRLAAWLSQSGLEHLRARSVALLPQLERMEEHWRLVALLLRADELQMLADRSTR